MILPMASPFWESLHSSDSPYARTGNLEPRILRALESARGHFGEIEGRRIIDIGCGNGATSLWFASHGAEVVAVDASWVAVGKLKDYCQEHGVRNVHPTYGDARDLSGLGPADFIFGSMILHHLEPFAEVAQSLREIVPSGRGFFYENNSASNVLVWCRNHLVGRYGVPKYGDSEEFPLTPAEVEVLRRHFVVRQEFPEMYFLSHIPHYLLREHMVSTFEAADRLLFRTPLRRWSYLQYLYLG
jgi:SAM-dependent methyltransferase